jgi:hypothetical protein
VSISNYAENKLLDTLRNVSFSVATVYVKLHVGDPGEAATANAAVETTRKAVTFNAASGGSMTNSNVLTWTNVAGSEDFTYLSLWDDSTAGNALWSGPVTANPVTTGDTFEIAAGQLTLTLD